MSALETVRRIKESVSKPRVEATAREKEFSCFAPAAKKVCLAGTFNNWNPTTLPMKKEKDGTWKIKIKLAGKHEYKYVVDGAWMQDPRCAEIVANSFGGYNCVISV